MTSMRPAMTRPTRGRLAVEVSIARDLPARGLRRHLAARLGEIQLRTRAVLALVARDWLPLRALVEMHVLSGLGRSDQFDSPPFVRHKKLLRGQRLVSVRGVTQQALSFI